MAALIRRATPRRWRPGRHRTGRPYIAIRTCSHDLIRCACQGGA